LTESQVETLIERCEDETIFIREDLPTRWSDSNFAAGIKYDQATVER